MNPIGRRNFLGGIFGSIAGAMGWKPKEAVTATTIDLDPYPLKPIGDVLVRSHFGEPWPDVGVGDWGEFIMYPHSYQIRRPPETSDEDWEILCRERAQAVSREQKRDGFSFSISTAEISG